MPTITPPPKVTVLMTLYNKGPWVEESVQSVLAQTFKDFELLVVDDASTDDGLEKVRAMGDPRIRIVESPVNTGRAAAANRGYDAAKGEYVAVLDADDLMHAERLAKQVAFMDAHPEVGACGTWGKVMGGRVMRMPLDDEGCRGAMLFDIPVLYPSAMLRGSVLEEHGLRCDAEWKHPGMDYLFLLHVGRHTAYANLPEAMLLYREGANNMRHGRNRPEDIRVLDRATFELFDIHASEAERETHLAFHNVWPKPPRGREVRALWQWKQDLARQNRERGLFPVEAFETELDRRWAWLFHFHADQGFGAGWTHLSLSRSWPKDRVAYLLKVTLNRWMGRSPVRN